MPFCNECKTDWSGVHSCNDSELFKLRVENQQLRMNSISLKERDRLLAQIKSGYEEQISFLEKENSSLRAAIRFAIKEIGDGDNGPPLFYLPVYERLELSLKESEIDRIYPCTKCGILRTKQEGGTVFTVCDTCWDKK